MTYLLSWFTYSNKRTRILFQNEGTTIRIPFKVSLKPISPECVPYKILFPSFSNMFPTFPTSNNQYKFWNIYSWLNSYVLLAIFLFEISPCEFWDSFTSFIYFLIKEFLAQSWREIIILIMFYEESGMICIKLWLKNIIMTSWCWKSQIGSPVNYNRSASSL